MFKLPQLRYAVLFLCIWLVANLVANQLLNRQERSRLEAKYALRPGILSEFSEHELRIDRPKCHEALIRYRLFTPHDSTAQTAFPLVICLHGVGERGSDNAQQLNWLPSVLAETGRQRDFPCFILAPQCPSNFDWTRYRKSCLDDDEQSSEANDLLLCLLRDVLKDSRVDASRVYLVGFSMGSFGAWELAADFPDMFAAVVPIAGGGRTNLAASLVNVPIWTVHGDNDETCPVQQTRDIVDALKAAGAVPRYSELCGIGHDAWKPAFRNSDELLQWMFQQRKSGRFLAAGSQSGM